MTPAGSKLVLIISTIGQLFCGMACLTSASRMCYAFSRDGAIPGWRIWSRVNQQRIPVNAVLFMARSRALIITIPALLGQPGRHPGRVLRGRVDRGDRPLHRLRDPDLPALAPGRRFEAGPWTIGTKYKWMNPFAIVWVGDHHDHLLPAVLAGRRAGRDDFDWNAVNYAPLVTGGVMLGVGIWWLVSARNGSPGRGTRSHELDDEIGERRPRSAGGLHGAAELDA